VLIEFMESNTMNRLLATVATVVTVTIAAPADASIYSTPGIWELNVTLPHYNDPLQIDPNYRLEAFVNISNPQFITSTPLYVIGTTNGTAPTNRTPWPLQTAYTLGENYIFKYYYLNGVIVEEPITVGMAYPWWPGQLEEWIQFYGGYAPGLSVSFTPVTTPLPGALVLFGSVLAGVACRKRERFGQTV
jgi:hypothetical protein